MSIIKYRTPAKVWGNTAPITVVACISQTPSTITTAEGRTLKVGDYWVHHDTWEAARDYLRDTVRERVVIARRTLHAAHRVLDNIDKLSKPA